METKGHDRLTEAYAELSQVEHHCAQAFIFLGLRIMMRDPNIHQQYEGDLMIVADYEPGTVTFSHDDALFCIVGYDLSSMISEALTCMDPDELRDNEHAVNVTYTNWEGVTAVRRVIPIPELLHWGSDQWHPEPQWILPVIDCDKADLRYYTLATCDFAKHTKAG